MGRAQRAGSGTVAASAPYPDAALPPVPARITVADTVYRHLREALILGRFDPAQALTIGGLAASFQTSHMPVREALRRLAAEGALEVRANGSARVPHVTHHALHDIARARVALECLAAELAAAQMSDAELRALDTLENAHRCSAASGDVTRMLEANRSFHFAVYAAARSPVLLNLIESLWLRYGPFMRALSLYMAPRMAQGTHEPFVQGHHEIVAALRAADGAAVRVAVQRDIEGTRDLLESLLHQRERGEAPTIGLPTPPRPQAES